MSTWNHAQEIIYYTLLQIRKISQDWLMAGNGIDVLYLDFRNAFDSVPHDRRLSKKIRSYGIARNIYNWIQAWNTDRRQRAIANGEMLPFKKFINGVPQGGIWRPSASIIVINDLPDAITSFCKFSADGNKIYASLGKTQSNYNHHTYSLGLRHTTF